MGEKVDFEDGDTSKRKMLFLSETVARYSYELPNAAKVEVVSTKVSGNSNAFGFSNPQIISFYENNINVGSGLNPRGYISPISSNALNYYTYKFEGSFYENGNKEVISNYKSWKLNGLRTLYYENGNKKVEKHKIKSIAINSCSYSIGCW